MNQDLIPSSLSKLSTPSSQILCTYAEITSNALMDGATYRWLYTIQPLRLEDDVEANSFEDFGDPIKAINIREFKNTSTTVNGIGISTLPSGFDFVAVTGVVACWGGTRFALDSVNTEAVPCWLFQADNPVSGTCT